MSTKLTRPQEGRMIGGVCAGIARSLDVDVTIVRIITAALVVFAGAGPLAYLVAWAIIPNESTGSSFAEDATAQARESWANRNQPRHPQSPDEAQGETFDPYKN
ncbi:MAG: PspC domain-containing protein [Acidipropionibacterium acidipropionici]|jgi:phage shock protein C|uniref:PspC family transcriptional regulator n=2 Tax=Acidipropionibacterium acidipropionici TaxID=1748 RepID=A0A142KFX3_9ACTN|nr:PspC domain-containing protein [Acidipropionibacterium acidipropionici]AFV90261.1 PspC domain-containing protein [Acidipropionibacterium acidipropionici ATCC 4875]ALN15484.1 PspC family transcriptional regulator [Acidipropionibacterium acidipropionici]AMS05011.1 PspC family transcriptional regulator [Acidipropionibacterium acidipropionici]AOZ46491.1 PspC family transcriptional regulator [Acidipropionibacterium acidipropionici]APZ08768.1 PspC family transcriptional regulator [Acidipropioniba